MNTTITGGSGGLVRVIDVIDKQLTDWLTGISGGVPVVLTSPGDITAKPVVSLYLMDVRHGAKQAASRRLPVQFNLCYLICTWSDNELDAHELLSRIIVAAMDVAEYETQLEPLPHSTWSAFGIAPRPSVIIRVPVQIERPLPEAPAIRSHIELVSTDIVPLHGVVLSPQRKPMPGVNVELSEHRIKTHTDINGRFYFQAVPKKPDKKKLLVQTRTNSFTFDVDASNGEHPLEIQLQSAEG